MTAGFASSAVEVVGIAEVVYDYPWMRVTQQQAVGGTVFSLTWTEDAEADDFELFYEHVCPSGALLDMSVTVHEGGVVFGQVLTYWLPEEI